MNLPTCSLNVHYFCTRDCTRHQDVFNRSFNPVSWEVGSAYIAIVYPAEILSWIELWEIWRPNQPLVVQPFISKHSSTLSALRQGALSCWKRPDHQGQDVHERVYSLQQCLGRWYVSMQASITQASLLYFLPIVHPGVMCSPGKQCTWIFFSLCGPVLFKCSSLLPSPVDKGHHGHLDLGASLPLFLPWTC